MQLALHLSKIKLKKGEGAVIIYNSSYETPTFDTETCEISVFV
jgi:hypothetical protein